MQKIEKRKNGTIRVVTVFEDESLVQPQFQKETDINEIIAKYNKTGQLPNDGFRPGGVYADFSQLPDYQGALQTVINAQDSFLMLPADVRARFDNDPARMIDFLSDRRNDAEAQELGLVMRPEQPPVQPQSETSEKKA